MTPPRVSVLMGVYNAERYLREALDSLLEQSFEDFEVVLVDDGSTDRSAEILGGYDDPRLRMLANGENLGHPRSLNIALEAARGPLIARLDADDVAEPERLERQVAEMDRRPELDVLGTWTTEIDEHGAEIGGFSYPPSETLIRWGLARTNVVYHPTVIMRRSMLERVGGYRPEIDCADDYDLFTRILEVGGRIGILPERLIRYRRYAGQISNKRVDRQLAQAREVRRRYVSWLTGREVGAEIAEAASELQRQTGRPPPSGLLRGALAVQLAVQRAVAADAPRSERAELRDRSREALLYHARELRRAGRTRDAAAVWRGALTRGGWYRDGVWREGAAILGSMFDGREA